MKNRSLEFTTFNPEEFVDRSANALMEIIVELLKNTDQISIALSGGNSPLPVYKKLASFKLDWERIKFFIVDERCVPNDHPDSNYGNISACLFEHIKSESFPVINSEGSYQKNAEQYEAQIKQHLRIENSLPQFDLLLLGMGLDGHTASLFPETDALQNKKDLIVLNEVPQLSTQRITMTYPLIKNAKKIVLMAQGDEKKMLLNTIFENYYPISEIVPQIYMIIN